MIAGLSTLGILLGYAVGTGTDVAPTTGYIKLGRVNSIGGISLDTEQIDASALEDEISRYVNGRQDNGGTWSVTFNYTDEVAAQLQTMIAAYEVDKGMFFEVYSPNLANGFFVKAIPPKHIPMPEIGQNELLTIELTFTIEKYLGIATAVVPA